MSTQESSVEQVPDNQDDKQLTEDTSGASIYFAVSPLKLIVMSICTIGIYDLYWFYKNWVLIKEKENLDIMPVWRAIFAYFFCYSLFKKIKASAITVSLDKPLSPGLFAAGWIIVTLLWKLPDPFWLISYFSVIFLLPIQVMVNEINEVVAPTHNRNSKLTGWNIFGVIVGGLFFLLVLWGTFLPETDNSQTHGSDYAQNNYDTVVDCADLIGKWKGEYQYNNLTSAWVTQNMPNGDLIIDFEDTENGTITDKYRLKGFWECKDGILHTQTTGPDGTTKVYKYKILTLNETKFVYHNLRASGNGPTFESYRFE